MNTKMYEFIEENEETHWWFRARQNIIRMFLLRYRNHYNTVLDIGCGSGHFLQGIKDISTNRFGIDEQDYRTAWHTVNGDSQSNQTRRIMCDYSSCGSISLLSLRQEQ